MNLVLPPLIGLGLALAWAPPGAAAVRDRQPQEGERDQEGLFPWQRDPYTRNEREAMKAAGYLSFGPMPWADHHGTQKIEEALGDVQLRWVETAHFRIGLNLGEYKPADPQEKKKLAAELERLEGKLPGLKAAKVKKLDPWLRLHLYAMRCEELYQEIGSLLGASDADFPGARGELVQGKYQGEGPYLGMPGKFTLLLTQKASSLGRYATRFIGSQPGNRPIRHMFPQDGVLMFGSAAEYADGSLGNDTTMHCHVVFNLTQNLMSGYRYYAYGVPVWITEGMSHWQSRRLDPRYNNFSQVEEEGPNLRKEWDWEPKVRGRVKNDYYPRAEDLTSWLGYERLKFADHMNMWSRMDFLMTLGADRFAAFMDGVKERPAGEPGGPTPEQLLERQRAAFEKAYGMDYGAFDQAWAAWVLKNYSD